MKQGYEAIRLTDKELTKHVSGALYVTERPPVMHNTPLYNFQLLQRNCMHTLQTLRTLFTENSGDELFIVQQLKVSADSIGKTLSNQALTDGLLLGKSITKIVV